MFRGTPEAGLPSQRAAPREYVGLGPAPGRGPRLHAECSKELRQNAWVQALLGRCARLKAAVALANKTARVAWALMARGGAYRPAAAVAAAPAA